MKINIDRFDQSVMNELYGYEEEIEQGLRSVVKRAGQSAVRKLRTASPKRTGDYAKGWTQRVSKESEPPETVVYNRKKPYLTHLLENGHQKADGGRVEGKPHIQPAAESAESQALRDAEAMIREVSGG